MTEERSFEILHFSVRYPRKVSQFSYFVHNLVWRAIDPEFKSLCEGMAADWTETEIVFDRELAEEYINGLDFSCTEIENQFGYSRCEIIQRDGLRRDAV